MPQISSLTSITTQAATNASRTSVTTESEAQTLSLIKTSYFNVTINTVNQSPTSVSTERSTFKHVKRVLDCFNDN